MVFVLRGLLALTIFKTKLLLQAEYQRDAEKMMHHHSLPLDYPEFVRAKESAKNASDVSKSFPKTFN